MILEDYKIQCGFVSWIASECRLKSRKRNHLAVTESMVAKAGGSSNSALTRASKSHRFMFYFAYGVVLVQLFILQHCIGISAHLFTQLVRRFKSLCWMTMCSDCIGWTTLRKIMLQIPCFPIANCSRPVCGQLMHSKSFRLTWISHGKPWKMVTVSPLTQYRWSLNAFAS